MNPLPKLWSLLFPAGLTSWVISRIRTFVPLAAGAVIVWIEHELAVEIDDAAVIPVVYMVTVAAYYEIVRRLERRWPKWGWLLGYPSEPAY